MSSLHRGFAQVIGAAMGGGATSSWFGDGSDGDLVISTDTPISVTEDTGHIFLQYKSIHIASGGVLRPSNRCAGMVVLCRGDCVIDVGGSINLDKMAPRRSEATENAILTSGVSAPWLQKISLLTGGAGGTGGSGRSPGTARGGAGGTGHPFGGGYGGGGGAGAHRGTGYSGGASEPRPPVSVEWPFPASSTAGASAYGAGGSNLRMNIILGGSAPGGSGAYSESYQYNNATRYRDIPGLAGDAYGGGLVLLVVGGNLSVAGTITANAGNGASAGTREGMIGGGPGGGGGGGIIAVLAKGTIDLSGSITANGGLSGVNHSDVTVAAQNGSIGTVYVHQVDNDLNVLT